MEKNYGSDLMKRPVVSVIVPIYNGEQYISKCLDSLAAQTLENIQVILVNDGSKDHSEDICRKYTSLYGNFSYYSKENGGSASARNLGLEHALGEYIGFVDSDDWVEPDMFQKMYDAAKINKADIVFNTMRKSGVPYPFAWPVPGYYDRAAMKERIFPELLPHPTDSGTFRSFDWGNWSKLIKRELIEKNRLRYYAKSRRCEDLCFAFECTVHAQSYYVMEHEPLYHYCLSDTSKSRHYTKNMWNSIAMLMKNLITVSEQEEYDFSTAVDYCILYFCVIVLRNEVFGPQDSGQMDRINSILQDPLCQNVLYLVEEKKYNKEYTAIFKAMRSGSARNVIAVMEWYAWKKKYVAPLLSKLHGRKLK